MPSVSHLAVLLALPIAACVADVIGDEPVSGVAAEPGISYGRDGKGGPAPPPGSHWAPGACSDMCLGIATECPDWQEQCDDASWPHNVWCAGARRFLDCEAAASAANGDAASLEYCYRTCEHLD